MVRRNFLKTGLAGMGALAVPGAIQAMGLTQRSSAKKWAVVYGTDCGSTKDAATWINDGMGGIATVVDITTSPKVNDYDFFVIGGWIRGEVLNPTSITSFITSNKAVLKDKIKGLFTVCGNMGNPVTQAEVTKYLTKQIIERSGITDKPAKLFNGRNIHSCSKLTSIKEYDLLKKEDCTAFGKQIVDAAVGTLLDGSQHSHRFGLTHSVNQFTSLATISYALPRSAAVLLTVSALNGKQIATLVSARQEVGSYSVKWNTGDVAPGIYLYRLETAGFVESRVANIAAR